MIINNINITTSNYLIDNAVDQREPNRVPFCIISNSVGALIVSYLLRSNVTNEEEKGIEIFGSKKLKRFSIDLKPTDTRSSILSF